MTWKPIETAPKDGHAFIAWLDDEGFSTMCRWNLVEGLWWFDGFDYGQEEADGMHIMTAWQPFPAGPGSDDEFIAIPRLSGEHRKERT